MSFAPYRAKNQKDEEKAGQAAGSVEPDVEQGRAAPAEDLDRLVDGGGKKAERRKVEQPAAARERPAVSVQKEVQKQGKLGAEQGVLRKMGRSLLCRAFIEILPRAAAQHNAVTEI